MRKFLVKILYWIVPVILLHVFLAFYSGGNTDNFYRRFTTPKQSNLILGNSRAAQGILPQYLQSKNGEDFFNYSFTIFTSQYGEVYFEAIKEKLNETTKDGMFILTVDPWSIAVKDEVKGISVDRGNLIGRTNKKNGYPNFEYLIKNYKKSWYNLYRTRDSEVKSDVYLHENGWLDVTVKFDSVKYRKNIEEKLEAYHQYTEEYEISESRILYLNNTISTLKNHGKVYLVRMPQYSKMLRIENQKYGEFDSIISEIAGKHDIKYFNFSDYPGNFFYTDGNHLEKKSGERFTKMLNDSIKAYH